MIIKAISVRQPWASMIANKEKTIEIREWNLKYRGPLAICSGKTVDPEDKEDCKGLPLGNVVAIADLINVSRATIEDEERACCSICEEIHYSFKFGKIIKLEDDDWKVKGRLKLFGIKVPTHYEQFIKYHFEYK